jgi:phytol kinase
MYPIIRNTHGCAQQVLSRLSHLWLHRTSPVVRDVVLSSAVMATSVGWLQLWVQLARRNKIETALARKIIHTGSAPLFLLLWPFYSSSDAKSKLIAAAVPLLTILNLLTTYYNKAAPRGLTDSLDRSKFDLVDTISRGNRKEAIQGPLIYSFVLLLATLIWFR